MASSEGESGIQLFLRTPSGTVLSVTVLPSDCPRCDLPRLAPCAVETTGTQKPVCPVNYDTLQISNVSC